jgi:hypothetical protein
MDKKLLEKVVERVLLGRIDYYSLTLYDVIMKCYEAKREAI